jgi:hypothetical protein
VPPVGGPVTLEETDRILQCNFCKTRLYIQPKDYFRYCFPYSAAVNEEIIYVPYWRFRGMSFKYRTSGTTNTLIDKTFLAIEDKSFPDTLGVRPQSLNIRFAQKKEQERYLEPKISFSMSSIQTDNHLLDAMLAIHDIKPALFNWGGAQNEADEAMAKINEDKPYLHPLLCPGQQALRRRHRQGALCFMQPGKSRRFFVRWEVGHAISPDSLSAMWLRPYDRTGQLRTRLQQLRHLLAGK